MNNEFFISDFAAKLKKYHETAQQRSSKNQIFNVFLCEHTLRIKYFS